MPEPATGVVVLEGRGAAEEKAGLRPGDLILSWCRATPEGGPPCTAPRTIDSPFAFADLVTEQIPRGQVRLLGRRDGEEKTWDLDAEPARLAVRPVLQGGLLALARAARENEAAGRPEAAAEDWRAAAAGAGDDGLAAWFLAQGARALAGGRRGKAADALYGAAIARAEQGGRHQAASQLLLARGAHAQERGDLAEAEDCFRRAESRLAATQPESLRHATALRLQAIIAMQYNELDQAESFLQSSLSLCERLVPGGLDVAATLHDLGILEMARGDDPKAVQNLERALRGCEEIAFRGFPSVEEYATIPP